MADKYRINIISSRIIKMAAPEASNAAIQNIYHYKM